MTKQEEKQAMNDAPAIHFDQVVFRYQEKGRRNILDGVSFDIPPGRVTLLMGSSGCGKSTLAAVAAGLLPENGGFLERGSIELFGQPLSAMNPQERADCLSMMFQNPDLQFCMNTLRKEMIFCLENICVPPEQMEKQIQEAAQELGVVPLLDQNLHTLSGGEKQKAMLACLYVMRSRCILLDECFANIDEEAAAQLLRMLGKIKDAGRTIVAIDHKADLWMDFADEICILGEGGKVVERGIDRTNAEQFREVFSREGLYFPGEPARPHRAAAGGEVMLRFEDLSIPKQTEKRGRLRRPAQPDLLLEHAGAVFRAGTMTAVLGPSGCGKTSTFLAVLKQHPYDGKIEIDQKDLSRVRTKELYRKIGIVFQNPASQFITQNVEEEVFASLKIWEKGISEDECRRRADALLESFGLGRYRKYSPYMLSQGQQRRLAVLCVLACGQKILLLDEPTYGQDERSTAAIMELLRKKTEEEGLTVIFITHDRALAAAWADHIYLVRDRKLAEMEPGISPASAQKEGKTPLDAARCVRQSGSCTEKGAQGGGRL